ncbi:MAG: hypothetical protein DBX42_05875 [Azospirillum sp.]|jgi:hypothetical protein|nr:MAG: hypothetical protein DBX42_05875 [Azospirillum sp.]DAJ55749.1 MAG TPA: hypothetical protein [Caudoviricetes sp.]
MDYKQDELDLKIKILTRYLIMAAEEKRFVSYAEINKLLGTSLQQSGFIAGEVGNYCSKNNLPFLNALIVSRNGFPGHDWYRWYSGKAQYKKEEAALKWCETVGDCIRKLHLKQDKKQKYSNTKKVK